MTPDTWIAGGPWAGRKCIGCSLAVGVRGEIMAKGAYGVDARELIVAEIALHPRTLTGTDIAPMLRDKAKPAQVFDDTGAALK